MNYKVSTKFKPLRQEVGIVKNFIKEYSNMFNEWTQEDVVNLDKMLNLGVAKDVQGLIRYAIFTTIYQEDVARYLGDGNTFFSCDWLDYIRIPGEVKTIKNQCFRECNNLHTVVIDSGVVKIGTGAFMDCQNLEIYIPASVDFIGAYCFSNIDSLKIHCEKEDDIYDYLRATYGEKGQVDIKKVKVF